MSTLFQQKPDTASPTNPKRHDPYRGATVEDLDPPPALSCTPHQPVSSALMSALERDFTHLTVISQENRALLGYLNIPKLQAQLDQGEVSPLDPVEKAMTKFRRKGTAYRVITKDTPLIELQAFFDGTPISPVGSPVAGPSITKVESSNPDNGADPASAKPDSQSSRQEEPVRGPQGPQDFAIVTDPNRRFVIGVATRADLEEFVRRRPACVE